VQLYFSWRCLLYIDKYINYLKALYAINDKINIAALNFVTTNVIKSKPSLLANCFQRLIQILVYESCLLFAPYLLKLALTQNSQSMQYLSKHWIQ